MATLIVLVMTKHCSDLMLLHIENQPFFVSTMLLFMFLYLLIRWIDGGHLPPQIHIESHSNINVCPVFHLNADLQCTEPFRKKSDGSQVSSLFLGNSRQHIPISAKMIFPWVRKVLSIAKVYMSLGTL